jgi:spermidine synthase
VRPGVVVLVTALFFASGAAGLVYQVLWMRSLSLFFGSDMYGVSIILGTFMGGLALGSLAGGWLAERISRPLVAYGLAELAIGLFALRFTALLSAFEPMLQAAYPAAASTTSGSYHLTRVVLAVLALLVPTLLMGATLPLIMRHFARARDTLGATAARFYAVNTLGALAGTLTAGFVLLPYLGTRDATACAATLNLLVGGASLLVGLRSAGPRWTAPVASELDTVQGFSEAQRRGMARAAVIAMAVSGCASFALEVVWTRILLISFSATVYSFTSMLACFLFGIFLGSRMVSGVVDRHEKPLALLAALELGAGLSVAVLCLLINAVPGLFGRLFSGVAALMGAGQEHTLVVATLVTSFALLVIPTTLLGATFPVALRAYTISVARAGSRTGNLYGANTLGAIVGSLGAGLVCIPAFGSAASLAGVALLFTATGLFLVVSQGRADRAPWLRPAPVAAAAAAGLLALASLAMPYRVTFNFNQRANATAELLYHADGIQNTVDLLRSREGTTALVIGGNIEADDGPVQRRHFVLKGHLPLMLHEAPRSVLVVGLGMGITLQATARHGGLERIDVVELSPEIVEAQAFLRDVNGDILNDPLVHVRVDDGRLFMKLTDRRYDMITADPIHPKISRVGYLYTREYYRSIRKRLNPGGVVCQWMPIYQIAPDRLRSAVATFLDVFPEATLWYVDNHALLVAKRDTHAIDYGLLARKLEIASVRDDLASIDIGSPVELLGHLLMGPEELRAYVADGGNIPLNTDDSPYLEYFVPRDLFYRPIDNTREFVPHLVAPASRVVGLPESEAAALAERSRGRAAWLEGVADHPY